MIFVYFILCIVAVSAGKYEECGENASWKECECDDYEPSGKPCPIICVRQCVCNPGYVKGPHGKCILEEVSPPENQCSGENEFWNDCGSNCEQQCNESENSRVCLAICVPKCTCKPGYVRGPGGKCILKEDCPPKNKCSGRHEFWNDCGSDCEEQCHESENPRGCAAVCVPKCSCKRGYVRGPGGHCVAKEDCPPKHICLDPNAIWSECASGCDQHSCGESDEPKSCPAVCLRQCTCKPGYVTGPRGNCILKKDCPPKNKCSGRHEFWNDCGSDCEEQCNESENSKACPAVCVPKCSCKPGYVRGPDGNCVEKKDCPLKPICLDPNAVWSECASACNQHSCGESDEPKFCPAVCLRQCTCKPGYVTGPHGNCILKKDCPPKNKCLGRHEFWNDCGSDCEEQCNESENSKACPAVCVPKCSCKPGYVRGPDGNCVEKKDCPLKPICLDPNAVWSECASACNQHSCGESDEPKFCPAVCLRQCTCKPGYVTGPHGNCILKKDCPPKNKCLGRHEFWNDCGSDCEEQCNESENSKACPAVCVPKCSCKRGYVRGPDGNCVEKKDCPLKPICLDPNAVWSECASACNQHSCGESDEPKFCPAVCLRQCTCKPGYVTGPHGNCILKKDCPPKNKCLGRHEFWNDCGSDCEEQCNESENSKACPAVCVPKCSCKRGYVRGPDGNCVEKKDCPLKPICLDPNAVWSECASACNQHSCGESDEPKFCPAVCLRQCTCKPGYVTGPHGNCILKKDCPPKNKCLGRHEFWNDCGSDCEEQCNESENSKACPAVCVPKCSCKPGYVRGPDGNCVAKKDCPLKPICLDPNAVWSECASACNQHSCGESDEPKFCPAVCLRQCTCKPGYVTGPHGNCILKKDCPPKNKCSGRHEFWNDCGSDCEEQCNESENSKACPAVCVPKCSCKRGYVRGPGGHCVAKEDCPPKHVCLDPNAVWSECASGCDQHSCGESDEPKSCAAVCLRQCTCKPGYVTGPRGNCILKEDCPPKNKCLGRHEFWNDCGSYCEEQCNESDNSRVCPAVCVPKCSCKRGYVRGPGGNCVAKKDCPRINKCSDPNEVWTNCGSACEKECEEPKPGRACPAICISKCSCKPGLVRGPDGKCIAPKDCPKKCPGKNQFWNECGNGCEPRCDKSHLHRACAAVCVKKCSCKPGYVIANNGDCIKEADCDTTCAYK